jgi:hypothetical protein
MHYIMEGVIFDKGVFPKGEDAMKTFGKIAGIGVLLAAAIVFYEVRTYELKRAAADESFSVFDFNASDKILGDLEIRYHYLKNVPRLNAYYAVLGERRAEIRYLKGLYGSLAGNRGELILSEEDSRIFFTRVNALYRMIESGRAPGAMDELLDRLTKGYEAVMRQDPSNSDAAFNYEYLIRTSEELKKKSQQEKAQKQQGNKDGQDGDRDQSQNGDLDAQKAGLAKKLLGKEGANVQDAAKGAEGFQQFVPQGKEEKSKDKGEGVGKETTRKKKG